MKKNTKWIIAGIIVLIAGCAITDYRFEIDYKINEQKRQWRSVSSKYDTLYKRVDTLKHTIDSLAVE